jgi:hypothetical protein
MVIAVPVAEALQLPPLELGIDGRGARRISRNTVVPLPATTTAAGSRAKVPSFDGFRSGAHRARCREAGQR